jgi:GntR family transcriptional regulator of arabinose operon
MEETRTPKYMRLKQEILRWLQEGKYKPEERIPSENEIAEQFGVSRQTVRQTLGELEAEGWLHRMRGKGTFVSPPRPGNRNGKMIGVLTTYISDYIFPHIVRGAEAAVRRRGYSLLLSSTDNDKARELECLRQMLSQSPCGLLVEPTKSAMGNTNLPYFLELQRQGVPMVMLHARYPEWFGPCIMVNDERGGYLATEHLLDLGHTRVAGFFKTDDLQGVGRLKGFLAAHRKRGMAVDPSFVVRYSTETVNEEAVAGALDLLRRPGRPTALVCYNDQLAVKILDAVRQAGLAVPGDVSVVGFDDSPLATATETKLTTLAHPKEELGMRAAEMLMDLVERPQAEAEDIVYEPELVVRDSTAAPQPAP